MIATNIIALYASGLAGSFIAPSEVFSPVWMYFIRCNGNEERLVDCAFPGLGMAVEYCDYWHSLSIDCWKVDPEMATADTLRLMETSETSRLISGRLEILVNDEWGTICDGYFGFEEAQVACRGLGYSGGKVVSRGTCDCS